MPLRWIIFKIICLLQITGTTLLGGYSLINFIRWPGFGSFASVVVNAMGMLLAVLGMQLLHRNYPDIPVAGKQKSTFNKLFVINFLLLSFYFGFIFSEYKLLKNIAQLLGTAVWDIPFRLQLPLFGNTVLLTFQLCILYGLFVLRRELYRNFTEKSFDFESR
ncbi:MAG TPA: hypothetical protein PKC69_12905 [Chitinophagaceae bacterium]|nr:hypothetical protein [Chitinophagaceae bacterium]